MEFLRSFCLSRTVFVYATMMRKQNDDTYVKLLNYVEQRIRKDYSRIYYELEKVKLPLKEMEDSCLNFRFVHTWRKFGIVAVKIQMWLLYHSLGVQYRCNKFKERLFNGIKRKSLTY